MAVEGLNLSHVTYYDTLLWCTTGQTKEENMFEIIMLFAFLSAAASQLLPSELSYRKRISQSKNRPERKDCTLGKPFQKLPGQARDGWTNEGRVPAEACAA